MTREAALRAELVEVGRRMYAQGFAAGSDGNLSARLDADHLLITPSGFSKGLLDPEQLLIVTLAGELRPSFHPRRRDLRPSSELAMHLAAYQARPDVHAVIHAHPPMGIACTVAELSLATCLLPEIIFHLGAIPTAPYATPGTAEGGSVAALVRHHDALLLERHGSLTVGSSPAQALMRLEWLEQAAKIVLAAHGATGGRVAALPCAHVERLQALRRASGGDDGARCTVCAPPQPSTPTPALVRAVTEAVLAALTSRAT